MKRVCLLTGASGALGREYIHRLADRYQIAAVHHRTPIEYSTQDQEYVDPLAPGEELEINRLAVHAIRADLADPAELGRAATEAVSLVGAVDLLINAAAVRSWSPILASCALAEADAMFRVNVLAPLRLSRQLALMVWRDAVEDNLRRSRNIVNVSSTAGLFVYPDTGQALYATTKAALNHLTYHLASEFWDIGIRVNAVAPDTFPGRVSPRSVIDAIVGLDCSQQTGEVLTVSR
jgi:NAD(P)-dependent dehydrogenase (short-subunit alcohol dehydrogenase family)